MLNQQRRLMRLSTLFFAAGFAASAGLAERIEVAGAHPVIELDGGTSQIQLRGATEAIDILASSGPSIKFTDGGAVPHSSSLSYIGATEVDNWRFVRIGVLELWPRTSGGETMLSGTDGGLVIASENPSQRYLVDSDENDAVANHIWYENSTSNTGPDWRMMQLTEEMGGTLYVDGPVTQNHTFDIAETFWEAEAIESGEVVAIDPGHPAAVRPTSTASQATMLGVASTRPGFVLGGGAFSLEAFRRTWGDEIADAYERQRTELEQRVFAEIPQLGEQAERLRYQASYEAYLAREPAELDDRPSAEEIRAGYQTARADHETLLFDRTLRRFFKDRFTRVALAGRVPVKADASFGAIRPGDYLTSSPIPGVAMRASGPGPIFGTALESLSAGTGAIQVFVHRGWYGGEGVTVGPAPAARRMPDPKDLEIAELKHRLAALEERLDGLALAGSALARSAGFPPPAAR